MLKCVRICHCIDMCILEHIISCEFALRNNHRCCLATCSLWFLYHSNHITTPPTCTSSCLHMSMFSGTWYKFRQLLNALLMGLADFVLFVDCDAFILHKVGQDVLVKMESEMNSRGVNIMGTVCTSASLQSTPVWVLKLHIAQKPNPIYHLMR